MSRLSISGSTILTVIKGLFVLGFVLVVLLNARRRRKPSDAKKRSGERGSHRDGG